MNNKNSITEMTINSRFIFLSVFALQLSCQEKENIFSKKKHIISYFRFVNRNVDSCINEAEFLTLFTKYDFNNSIIYI